MTSKTSRFGSVKAICRREFSSLFFSPIAYIVMFVYLLVTGWFFFLDFFIESRADLRNFFGFMPIVFSFTIPAITMRLFAEEFRSGSFEILAALPLDRTHVLLGKYLSAVLFVGLMLIPTLSYPLFVSFFGDLDPGPVIGGYIGGMLLAASYVAIGTLTSAATKNQIISFLIAALVCLFLTLIRYMLVVLPSGLLEFFQSISSTYHFEKISRGLVDSRDLLYFFSVIFLSLFATGNIIKEKV